VAPAHNLHPEFGLLCPSPKFRRGAKVTLACLAGSIIIGALALQVSHERGADGALLIAHGADAAANTEVAPTVGRAAMTAEISPVPEDSVTACEGDASNRSDPKCGVGKVRKLKSRRAANEGAIIGALPLGRIALVAPEPFAATPGPTDAANSEIPAPAVANPQSPRAAKKARKPSRRTGGRDWARDWRLPASQWSARAYAPDNPYLRGHYQPSGRSAW
jgi:hypothetical protein